jgi:hypothetical protein
LLESRAWALGYTVANWTTVDTMSGDYWGLANSAVPRFSFQALLPFLLLAMLRYGAKPWRWPLFMAASGALVYVHPVSAPSVAFANLLGLASYELPSTRRWLEFAAAGATFLIVALPFALIYRRHHSSGPVADYPSTIAAMKRLQGAEFYDAGLALRHYLFGAPFLTVTYAAGITGIVCTSRWQPSRARDARFFAFWLIGLLATTAGITVVEQALCERLHRLPFEIDLIRNLRYAVPVLMLFGAVALKLLSTGRPAGWRLAVRSVSLAILLAWLGVFRPNTLPLRDELRCLLHGHAVCTPESATALEHALLYMRDQLPLGSRILPVGEPDAALAVRYVALQPVLYCYKDRNVITYGAADRLAAWTHVEAAMAAAESESIVYRKLAAAADVSRNLGADFIFINADTPENSVPSGLQVVHRNGWYSVLKVGQL